MSLVNCRFYEEPFPEIDSLVMVNVKQINELGAYVKLLEYDNIDGLILLSELSRRRIRSIQNLIRIGHDEVAVVIRVDKDKGYIDLSKRRVSPEDKKMCELRYTKGKTVHSILRHVAEKTLVPIQTLYEKIAYPLAKNHKHAIDAFKMAIKNPEIWDGIEFPSPQVEQELKAYISQRLTPQSVKVRADVEVTCFEYEGIDAIKDALRAARDTGPDGPEITVKLVASPMYVLTTSCLEKDVGIARLDEAIGRARAMITKHGGNLNVKMAPKAVTVSDDAELQALMAMREREITQVPGDEDSDSDLAGPN